ncbi:MAG: glucose-1-phosphate cytidylyltransferase, partial [Bacilli bacterium]
MKVVILAGGLGTRISEESHLKPKPMIEIGGIPILVHIMKIYSSYGFNDFIICAGYKQQIIKEYFAHYYIYNSDITFDMTSNKKIIHNPCKENWKVTVVDTGLNTMTGGRIKRIKKYIGDEDFMLTYGDAVGDIDIKKLVEEHKKSNKIGTISVYNFGQLKGIVEKNKDGLVTSFREKSDVDGDLINIGFMVFKPEIFNYIKDDSTVFEKEPLHELVKNKELNSYTHRGFWQCMDTMREKDKLE